MVSAAVAMLPPAEVLEGAEDVCTRFEQWEEWDASMPLWKHAAAGSLAGVVEHVGMYPLDTVKTHMQALRPPGAPAALITDVVRNILREQGFVGFMRGSAAIVSGCIPAHIALFSSYEYAKSKLLTDSEEHEPARAAVCGATGTICHDLILTPMDVVKQRMQLGCYRGVGDCLRTILRLEGLGGLYRSMPTTVAMNVPFGSVLVASNESIKKCLGVRGHTRIEDSRAALPWYFLSAGLSGALASAATQPLDVVKTRLQTQDVLFLFGNSEATSSRSSVAHESTGTSTAASQASSGRPGCGSERRSPKYTGLIPAVTTIVREEGWRALYKGALPRMLHSVPSAAMCWGTYESVKHFLCS